MKKFVTPEISFEKFDKNDIIATSPLGIFSGTVDDYQSREGDDWDW